MGTPVTKDKILTSSNNSISQSQSHSSNWSGRIVKWMKDNAANLRIVGVLLMALGTFLIVVGTTSPSLPLFRCGVGMVAASLPPFFCAVMVIANDGIEGYKKYAANQEHVEQKVQQQMETTIKDEDL